jgi:hypothetical protein
VGIERSCAIVAAAAGFLSMTGGLGMLLVTLDDRFQSMASLGAVFAVLGMALLLAEDLAESRISPKAALP